MLLYKVESFTYDLANSLLPPAEPTGDDVTQFEAVVATPSGQEIVTLLMHIGYTPFQAEHLYRAIFNHYWYDFGIREVVHCNLLTKYWINSYVGPAWVQASEAPPPLIPAAVVYSVVVIAVISVVVLLVAPDWTENFRWEPPCNLYLGVYKEQLWWFTLAAVGPTQRPFYKALGYEGAVICARTYEYLAPPVVLDRFHFWGTLEWRCWQIPWFRVYRTQFADTIFIGKLQHVSGELYRLQSGYDDPFAPVGPYIVDPDDYCTKFSPCST